MSMDLNFWKYKENTAHDHETVYQTACCDGEIMEVLEILPIDDILKKVTNTFSDWTIQDGGKDFEKKGHGAFQIFTTSQIVRFDCYGMQGDDMNTLIDILLDFGCPLYDPQISTRFVATDRINKIFSQENESFAHKSYELQELEIYGDIKIGDLEFSYRDNQKILDKINTSFSKNSVTAIVGASGSGKTTMLNLLVRFYESEGNILIDGHNIKSLSINTLRNLVSYIQQDSFFFKDTIKNNLNIVNSNVTDEEIEEACKKAEIYNKIISLPNGFNTLLGENASILSGGEKQRLAIARGLLKKAKVFLFDEVTSNLDGETEKEILKTLLQLGEEYTVIIIAHRVTLVENIPRIIVLDKGRVVGEGNHNYLLGMCKEYQRLFKKRE